jgi:hypothetical protein
VPRRRYATRVLVIWTVLTLSGCAPSQLATAPVESATASPAVAATPNPCPTPDDSIPDVQGPSGRTELELGTYWVDPDVDACTPLRVLFTIPADGWQAWTGTYKPEEGAEEDRRVGVSIVSVTNLVVDGCTDHNLAAPPVGPTVDDLATALADLDPFLVTSPPSDVTIYGYSGKYLELALPEMAFAECVGGEVISWDAPVLSYPFHGYLPRLIEEFWILDVQGSRLVIVANRVPDSAPEDIAELRAILDSIQIEP